MLSVWKLLNIEYYFIHGIFLSVYGNFVIFFSLQKLKKMAEPRLLKLQSPAYGEPIFYEWPLINTVKYLLKFHNFILLILSILAGAKEKDYHSIGLKGVIKLVFLIIYVQRLILIYENVERLCCKETKRKKF